MKNKNANNNKSTLLCAVVYVCAGSPLAKVSWLLGNSSTNWDHLLKFTAAYIANVQNIQNCALGHAKEIKLEDGKALNRFFRLSTRRL